MPLTPGHPTPFGKNRSGDLSFPAPTPSLQDGGDPVTSGAPHTGAMSCALGHACAHRSGTCNLYTIHNRLPCPIHVFSSPLTLNNITGWIPRLENATALLLAAGEKHNPIPGLQLIDHYQIDYGMDGVEQDTISYGPAHAPPGTHMNYGRILGAEAIMRAHGLETGVILNANAAHMRTYAPNPPGCLVACDRGFTPSHSAVLRTLNVTTGYVRLPNRGSQHAIFEQWQAFPNATGPETAADTGMWMVSEAAAIVAATSDRAGVAVAVVESV